jgi:4-hydroxybenzoate polyprenyltransferase
LKTILAFLKLIRWQNLLFIVLTQILYEYCIYLPIYGSHSSHQLGFIILASVLIAADGYIINYYFDLNIDQINKPNRVIVNNAVSRRWAIFWHLVLSLLGLFFTVLALPPSLFWYLILANLFSILLLWLYSTNFKKQLLIGNVIISILTSWVILILFFSKSPLSVDNIISADHREIRLFRLTMLYAGFAFIISLIREVLKDMEDRIGDARYGCKTMPIVWGLPASKVFVAVWIIVLAGTLVILQLYVLAYEWWLSIVYCLLAIVAPLLIVLSKLTSAQSQQDFHLLSRYVKAIMFTGILSMLFFYYYH